MPIQLPRVESNTLPGVRLSGNAPPSAFGGAAASQTLQAGDALMRAGTVVSDIAIDLQERENATMIFAAESAVKNDYVAFDAEQRKRKGLNAKGVTGETDKWFADQGKQHSEALGNDRQREIFGQQLARMRTQAMQSASSYEAQEGERALADSTQASIVGSINIAAAAANEGRISADPTTEVPGPVPQVKRDISTHIAVLAKLNGWSPEKVKVETDRYTTIMHKQVIGALVDSDPTNAKHYYAANRDEIDGTERAQIEEVLRKGSVRQQAQEATDAIFEKGLSEREAFAYVRENYEGEAEDEINQRVRMRFAEADQIRERGQRRAADEAWSLYASRRNLDDVPTTLLDRMDGRDIETLRDHAQRTATGKQVVTDPTTYYGLRSMIQQNPAGFAALDLRRYVGQLSPADFEEFVKLQTGTPAERTDASTLQQQLAVTHNLLELKGEDAAKKGMLDKAVIDTVNAEQVRLGKKLNYDERQKIIDRMLIEGDVSRGFFNDSEGRYFEAAAAGTGATFVPNIPDADRDTITTKFKAKTGREPTDAEITDIFRRAKGL
jgi:hypothetical protein